MAGLVERDVPMSGTIHSMTSEQHDPNTAPDWAIADGRPALSTYAFQLDRLAGEVAAAQERLDAEIRRAHDAGMSDRAIARAARTTHPRIARILGREV